MMSLVPARYNFTIYQAATFYKRIFFQVNGKVEDLTGYSAELSIKDEPNGVVLLTLDSKEIGGVTLGGDQGTIDLKIGDVVTEEITWTAGVYELFITDTLGRVDVLMRGGFKVVPF